MSRKTVGGGLTWPQIRYWSISIGLIVLGVAATIWGGPWEPSRPIIKELGPGIFTAGILACLVEPFFRREFARDAFLSAFRYVLPTEFRDEITKILRFEWMAEKQVWCVKIDKIDDATMLVTTSFEKTIRNKTKSALPARGFYTATDFKFPNGPTKILDCAVENEGDKHTEFQIQVTQDGEVRASTDPISIKPEGTAKISGKAIQYKRISDVAYETFITPATNPEIEVIIPEEFEHKIQFGTFGDVTKSKYATRYVLSGVYFPGQYMFVQWWPKKLGHQGT